MVLKRSITVLTLTLTAVLIFTGCSYLDAVKRAKQNESNRGTKSYYDNKCLVAEECAMFSGKILLPEDDKSNTLVIAVVVEDGNESRVIDAQRLMFVSQRKRKASYFFFNLPVGHYAIYALKEAYQSGDIVKDDAVVLAKGYKTITQDNLKPYQNAIVLDDITLDSTKSAGRDLFPYALKGFIANRAEGTEHDGYLFGKAVNLDDPVFSHKMAMEGLYYPQSFRQKTKSIYRLVSKPKKGNIPVVFVHGMGGTPRDWKYLLEHLDLEHYTPYLLYYASGEDFSKLAAMYNAWIISDRIFEEGPGVVIAHSFGGVLVRDAINLMSEKQKKHNSLFISLASPFGGDAKASEGVQNAPYVIPAWRSIADDGDFIKALYRNRLNEHLEFDLIFAYDNDGSGPSGDGRVPLEKQLRSEAQEEARNIRGFKENHFSILNSEETAAYIDTLLSAFARENAPHLQK